MFENSLYPLYYIHRERRQGGVVGTQAKINNKESRRLKEKYFHSVIQNFGKLAITVFLSNPLQKIVQRLKGSYMTGKLVYMLAFYVIFLVYEK